MDIFQVYFRSPTECPRISDHHPERYECESKSDKCNWETIVQTGNMEWVERPWVVNSIHYPPYLEILYATFELNRGETVDCRHHEFFL